jgi:hypothetical protein
MKILDRLDISGSLSLASNAKDTFVIGTTLENNDGNVDNLYVHANAYFNNHVVLGSSSVDMVTVSGNLVINPVATAPTPQEGQIYYDSAKHELVYNSEVSTVLNSLGRSLLVRAKNTDSVTLTKGMAVRVGTPQGANKTFVRALSVNIPLTGAAGNQIIGIINSDIAVNDFGYATTFGEITGLNTNNFIEGDQVYVSSTTSGSLTGSRPTAPFEIIPVGICLSQHQTQGKIFVKTRDPTHFGDITGFNPDTTNLLDGQVIRYRSSDGTWGNSNSGVVLTGSFSGSLRTNSITSDGGYKINDNLVISQAELDLSSNGYGTGSYESGSLFKDSFGISNAEIIIGHLSSSTYNRDNDIIDLFNSSSGISIWNDGIDFYSPDGFISLQEIISAVQGGGGGGGGGDPLTSLQTTGSGESLIRDINNGTGYLRSLKGTSTINVVQQTNEIEFNVNSNLTLTSITSQGTLTVSGNVQLNDSSSDVTTVQGVLRLAPHNPLPDGEQGRLAVSGSNLYFHNGEQWKVVTLA